MSPVLSGEDGTICIALSDNEYSLLIQAYWIKNHPRLKQTALKIIPTVLGLFNLGQQRTNNVESHTQNKYVLPVRERFSIHFTQCTRTHRFKGINTCPHQEATN